jgi:hypothetical protein
LGVEVDTITGSATSLEAADAPPLDNLPSQLHHPAYVALTIAVGAAIYALTSTIGVREFSWKLWVALFTSLGVSYSLRFGTPASRQFCAGLLLLFVMMSPPLVIVIGAFAFVPSEARGDSNTFVAIVLAWVVIASILAVNHRYEGRPIPFVAPLVPTLSLFGLLNIISVNTVVSVCFLVFVAAALYLAAYQQMLDRLESQKKSFQPLAKSKHALQRLDEETGSEPRPRTLLSSLKVPASAAGYLVASTVWFVIFVAGAGLFYMPLRAMLPIAVPPNFNSSSLSGLQSRGDWSDAANILELSGGEYTLSEQEMLKVNVRSGTAPGLWRGRIYDQYVDSEWKESSLEGEARATQTRTNLRIAPEADLPIPPERFRIFPGAHDSQLLLGDLLKTKDSFGPYFRGPNCKGDQCDTVVETIHPLQPTATTLYSSGHPQFAEGVVGGVVVHLDGSVGISQRNRKLGPYTIQSQVLSPSPDSLTTAPGLSKEDLQLWRRYFLTAPTLQLMRDPNHRNSLMAIVRRIRQDAVRTGTPLETPGQKLDAISSYVSKICLYTLDSPLIPVNQDSVVYFLNESRLGACDMFASATIMLLRAMDVPARMATGFLQPDECVTGSECVVRERDAHAWVEFYVPSFGWVAHDATVGTRSVDEQQTNPITALLTRRIFGRTVRAWLPAMGGLLLLCVGFALTIKQQKRQASIPFAHLDPSRATIATSYSAALRLLARRVPRPVGCTPQEYESLILRSKLPHNIKVEVTALTYLFTQSQYAPTCPPSNEALMRASLHRLRRALRLRPYLLIPVRDSFKKHLRSRRIATRPELPSRD